MPAPNCAHCDAPRAWSSRFTGYCEKHLRIYRIRLECSRRGLYSPTRVELEQMLGDVPGECSSCGTTMIWRAHGTNAPKGRVASIQHWKNETVSIICFSCNARHGSLGGDDDRFFQCDKNSKSCYVCKQILPLSDFWKGSGFGGKRKHCKSCHKEIWAKRVLKNASQRTEGASQTTPVLAVNR